MKVALVIASAVTFLSAAVAPEAVFRARSPIGVDAGDLTGTYLCEGTRPDGAPYKGTVRIVRYNGAYQVIWNVGSEEQYYGIGLLTGKVLSVSYFGGAPGVVAYEVDLQDGARLTGQWTVANADGQVFRETLTRLTHEVVAPAPEPRKKPVRPTLGSKPA